MKYLLTIVMIALLSHVHAQDNRWKVLYFSDDRKKQTCVDTHSPIRVDTLDGHKNVVLIWVREYSLATQDGKYMQQMDQRLAIDIDRQQFEFKSTLTRYNDVIIDTKQFDHANWSNIYPESYGEMVLNYCKNYMQSK